MLFYKVKRILLIKKNYKNFYILALLLIPILFYLGDRSPIAYDEGYYILQSKFILLKNDWVAPRFFQSLVLDRTLALQSLIAISQQLFGNNSFFIYIPNILSGLIILILTYELHKELIGKKNAIISPLILSTTFLWLNYFHMATQDIIFSSLVTLGIFSTIKAHKTKQTIYFLFCGIWIGLGFALKTYLILIPLVAILPFLISSKIIFSKYFWIGALIGFIPFLIWSFKFITIYGFRTYEGLYKKLISLSEKNTFTNPFYYYVWNLMLNCAPWSFFSLLGFLNNFKVRDKKITNYFLVKFPLIIMILLSIFSTKTPYYPIQILSLISINSYLGIIYIFSKKNNLSKWFMFLNFKIIPIILVSSLIYINTIQNLNFLYLYSRLSINIAVSIFALSWLFISNKYNSNKNLLLLLLGPLLFFSITVQSGFLNDRSKSIRIESENIIQQEKIKEKKIEFITNNVSDQDEISKLIRIAIFMPKIGNGLKSIDELKINQYAWTNITKNEILLRENIRILANPESLKPWKLILRED